MLQNIKYLERHLGEWFDFVSVFVIMQNCWHQMAAMMINCEAFHNKLPPFPNLQRKKERKNNGKAINEGHTQAYFWELLYQITVEKSKKKSTFWLLHNYDVFGCFGILILYQHYSDDRREEKLYVEGMEDEDMKKETQNLAYPPAFKVTPPFNPHSLTPSSILSIEAGGRPVCQEAQPVRRRQDLQRGKTEDFWLDASGGVHSCEIQKQNWRPRNFNTSYFFLNPDPKAGRTYFQRAHEKDDGQVDDYHQ